MMLQNLPSTIENFEIPLKKPAIHLNEVYKYDSWIKKQIKFLMAVN
jgi:hypothetical protein